MDDDAVADGGRLREYTANHVSLSKLCPRISSRVRRKKGEWCIRTAGVDQDTICGRHVTKQ